MTIENVKIEIEKLKIDKYQYEQGRDASNKMIDAMDQKLGEAYELLEKLENIDTITKKAMAGSAFAVAASVGATSLPIYDDAIALIPEWIVGTKYKAKDIVSRKSVPMIYEVIQAVTAQNHQPPESLGMLAIYRPIPKKNDDGTLDYVYGMTGITNMIVRFNGRKWKYIPAGGTAVIYDPSTAIPAVWQDLGVI